MSQDRISSKSLPLTHEFLALMLGTRRSSVSLAAGVLQDAGVINYTRGNVVILSAADPLSKQPLANAMSSSGSMRSGSVDNHIRQVIAEANRAAIKIHASSNRRLHAGRRRSGV